MIYLAQTPDLRWVELGTPVSAELRRDEDAPADSLSVSFPLFSPSEQYRRLRVFHGDSLIFEGIPDEQRTAVDAAGALLRLEARSLAALLLDNEALPQIYERPSLPLLFRRHAAPYGFLEADGPGESFSTRLTVRKGMSEWAVLASFCGDHLGVTPRITPQGVLDATGLPPPGTLRFSTQGSTACCTLEEQRLFCKRLSEVWLQTDPGGSYSNRVTDEEAVSLGVRRRRLESAAPSGARPASYGEGLLRRAREQSYRLILLCPGWLDARIGQAALVEHALIGAPGALQVASLRYRIGPQGETTSLTLRKKEE